MAHHCHYHPQRPVFARCMSCVKMLCQECATQWDGIWHCAHCLGAKRGVKEERSPALRWVAVSLLTLTFLYCGARLMVWAGAIIAGMF